MEQQKAKQLKSFTQNDSDDNQSQSIFIQLEKFDADEEYFDLHAIDAIVDSSNRVLNEIRNKYNFLSKNEIKEITNSLNEALSDVFPILDDIDEKILEKIVLSKGMKSSNLIPILQISQERFGYLSKITLKRIAEFLKISIDEVFSVATFYTQFKFIPPGDHIITLCSGTACFVKGGNILLEAAEKYLKIKSGETTKDRTISLETVACLGCCALSPAVVIDGEIHGNLKPSKLINLIEKTKKGEI
ncbi:MAG: NAD(P)H-dependent oxidoreductase subunit E [Candidatus Heimdallarchaeota archaeon]|nr:NAD(P)H-dependent oxidoreductase subunit E [Candidatus Heimdallarchaeota archaeon]